MLTRMDLLLAGDPLAQGAFERHTWPSQRHELAPAVYNCFGRTHRQQRIMDDFWEEHQQWLKQKQELIRALTQKVTCSEFCCDNSVFINGKCYSHWLEEFR